MNEWLNDSLTPSQSVDQCTHKANNVKRGFKPTMGEICERT